MALGGCSIIAARSIVARSMRGGVPVFSRLVGNPIGAACARVPLPALHQSGLRAERRRRERTVRQERCRSPAPRVRARKCRPSEVTTPRTAPPDVRMSSTNPATIVDTFDAARFGDGVASIGRLVHLLAKRSNGRSLAFVKETSVQRADGRPGFPWRRRAHRSRAPADLSRFRRSTDCTGACKFSTDRR